MKSNIICEKNKCTGCGACIISCPKKCIELKEDLLGSKIPFIDSFKCINCNVCRKVCHINTHKSFVFPYKAYASWSKDEMTRANGASGGIASEIYKYAIAENIFIMATMFSRNNGVSFVEIQKEEDLLWARNSKYVYSDMQACYLKYEKKIRENKKCIFIALPCQIAAMKAYLSFKGINEDNVLYIDIICHGVPPFKYLDEHLCFIENRKKVAVDSISFRNPDSNFLLRCYTVKDSLIYSRGMHENDTYYRAFALNMNFRENCYKCQYARCERISDFTIGDYSGLGQLWPYDGDKEMVSLILSNSEKGDNFLSRLNAGKKISLIERPLAEPFSAIGNPQLRHPSVAYKTRNIFIKEYLKHGSYEIAAKKALRFVLIKFLLFKPFCMIKAFIAKHMPMQYKIKIKEIIKRLI